MLPESLFVPCAGAAGPHTIHVLKWSNQNPQSTLPPVVCVHGLTRMGYDFWDIAAHLAQHRDVVSITMAGRGKSDWLSDPAHYIYPTYVADCLFIIRETLKLSQVDWLGTSMGGLIGMWVAALDNAPAKDNVSAQPLIRKLVLNDIGPFLPLAAVQRIGFYAGRQQSFDTMEDVERYCRVIYAQFGITADKDWLFFAEHTVRKKEGGGFTLHYDPNIAKVFADVKEDVSVWPIYEAVTCPTLLLRGVQSDVLSKDIADDMTRRGPKAKLVTFQDCGHAPALINPEQQRVVEEFLS